MPAAMAWDVSCLNGEVDGLPDCSWTSFCGGVGIEKPEWAQEFLRCLAGQYRASTTRELPGQVVEEARATNKDPFVLWVWMLTPEFRGELSGMDSSKDPNVADNYYLLNVMRKYCRESPKDWMALTVDCMNDRELYFAVQRQVAHRLGLGGCARVGKFDD